MAGLVPAIKGEGPGPSVHDVELTSVIGGQAGIANLVFHVR